MCPLLVLDGEEFHGDNLFHSLIILGFYMLFRQKQN